MLDIIRFRFIQTLFVVGVCALLASLYFPGIDLNMRVWLSYVSAVTEGYMMVLVVQDEVRESPNSTFGQRLLPATLPFVVFVCNFFHLLGLLRVGRP